MASVSVNDPVLALHLVDGLESARERHSAIQKITMHLAADGQGELAAQTVLAMRDPRARGSALNMLSQIWASTDPQAALDWYVENQALLDEIGHQQFMANFAVSDLAQASRLIDAVPAEQRAGWMAGIAARYARGDPSGALEWLMEYRDEPGYAAAMAQVVRRQNPDDPQMLIGLMDQLQDPRVAGEIAAQAARAWARTDPAGAAGWAQALEDEVARSTALATVARQWAARDAGSAQAWVLGLPGGLDRDAAITSYLNASAGRAAEGSLLEGSLLEAYSSDNARQIGLQQSMYTLARADPRVARQLIDDYITDPTLRAQAEQALESARRP